MKKTLVVLLSLMVLFAFSASVSGEENAKVVTTLKTAAAPAAVTVSTGAVTPADADMTFENGIRVQKNGLTIVDLHGTWHEMGRQYGYLAADALKDVAALCEKIIADNESNATAAEEILQAQHRQMPYTIRSFFKGMEETSGLTMRQLECANAVERIADLPSCSFAAAWGDYASDGMVIGRNYDYFQIFGQLNDDVVIAVFHPADGAMPAAIIGYAGEIYAVNGLNEAGIYMALNNGSFSTRLPKNMSRVTGTTLLMEILFEADSLSLLDMYFESMNSSGSYIINAADGEAVRSYEWCPAGMNHGEGSGQEGVFVSTNHYISPEWDFEAPDEEASVQTTKRRANLLELCEAAKGSIDAETMMKIIDTRLEDGGAANYMTMYQLVVVPAARTLWMKMADKTEWTEFDIGAFFAA